MKKKKPQPLKREDFVSDEAYLKYVITTTIKKTNESIAETNKEITQFLKKKAAFDLHISILKCFFREDLMWFLDYNTRTPKGYILGDNGTLFPRIGFSQGQKLIYREMDWIKRSMFAAKEIRRSNLYS